MTHLQNLKIGGTLKGGIVLKTSNLEIPVMWRVEFMALLLRKIYFWKVNVPAESLARDTVAGHPV